MDSSLSQEFAPRVPLVGHDALVKTANALLGPLKHLCTIRKRDSSSVRDVVDMLVSQVATPTYLQHISCARVIIQHSGDPHGWIVLEGRRHDQRQVFLGFLCIHCQELGGVRDPT